MVQYLQAEDKGRGRTVGPLGPYPWICPHNPNYYESDKGTNCPSRRVTMVVREAWLVASRSSLLRLHQITHCFSSGLSSGVSVDPVPVAWGTM